VRSAGDAGRPDTTTGRPAPPANIAAETALARQLRPPALVMISRDGDGWLAEIAALGITRRAPLLCAVDRLVRELLGADVVDYHFHPGQPPLEHRGDHRGQAR
jgi:hypothetical protein